MSSVKNTFWARKSTAFPRTAQSNGISEMKAKTRSRKAYFLESFVCKNPSTKRKQKIGNAGRPIRRRTLSTARILSKRAASFLTQAEARSPRSKTAAPIWSISILRIAMIFNVLPEIPENFCSGFMDVSSFQCLQPV